MKNFDLRDLNAFVAVARTRNFRRAAIEQHVSVSSLSQRLRGMEERLGVRLMNRTTRSVALTEAGELLLSRVGPAMLQVSGALEDVRGLRAVPSGRLRINAPPPAILIANYPGLAQRAACDGVGYWMTFEDYAREGIKSGALVSVLEDWCAPFPGPFLYYPSRRQPPPALAAFVAFVAEWRKRERRSAKTESLTTLAASTSEPSGDANHCGR